MAGQRVKGFERHWYTRIMDWYRWSSIYIPFFNEAARLGLKTRFLVDRKRVATFCDGSEDLIEQWFGGLRLFFGFSSFRGGTVFLSNLLDIELERSHIEHEANVNDYLHLPGARLDQDKATEYLVNYRKNEIYVRAPRDIDVYGEINPFIRLHCEAFKAVFPTAKFFHMVRDPKDVVRSIMAREILSNKDPMNDLIRPPLSDPYFEQWPTMDRFERVCWEWQSDNRYIRSHIGQLVRFEDMMSDYEKFKIQLLDFLEIELDEKTWSSYVNRPRNASRKYRFDHWSQWDREKLRTFERICGDEMSEYGYEM